MDVVEAFLRGGIVYTGSMKSDQKTKIKNLLCTHTDLRKATPTKAVKNESVRYFRASLVVSLHLLASRESDARAHLLHFRCGAPTREHLVRCIAAGHRTKRTRQAQPAEISVSMCRLGLATHCTITKCMSQIINLADCRLEYYAFNVTFCPILQEK